MISEKVFLAFDTGRGLAYVPASGWQRAYLLWTFRNFRGVPHKILNDRQRELVETLYSAAPSRMHAVDETAVIGTVEDFTEPLLATDPVSAAIRQPVLSSSAKTLTDAPTRKMAEPPSVGHARRAFPGLARRVGAGAMIAAMAVLGWQQLGKRMVVSASTLKSVLTFRNEVGPAENRTKHISMATVTPPANTDALTSAQISGAKEVIAPVGNAVAPASTASQSPNVIEAVQKEFQPATSQPEPSHIAVRAHALVADAAGTEGASPDLPRIQISGPPRKIVYPESPEGSARGKVSLQAVVGNDGKVSQIRVLNGNRLLAAAAARAIRQWRYQPYSGDEQKVERETSITVSFVSSDVVAVSFPDAASVSR